MKKAKIGAILAVVAFCLSVSLKAHEEHHHGGKGQVVAITGEILDLACYLGEGEKGASHRQCALKCAKMGVPTGILDQKSGKIYLIVHHGKEDKALYEKVANSAGKVATVKGIVVEKQGLSALLIKK